MIDKMLDIETEIGFRVVADDIVAHLYGQLAAFSLIICALCRRFVWTNQLVSLQVHNNVSQ